MPALPSSAAAGNDDLQRSLSAAGRYQSRHRTTRNAEPVRISLSPAPSPFQYVSGTLVGAAAKNSQERTLPRNAPTTATDAYACTEARNFTSNSAKPRAERMSPPAGFPARRQSTAANTSSATISITGTQDSTDCRRRSTKYQRPGSIRARTSTTLRRTAIDQPSRSRTAEQPRLPCGWLGRTC
jgi:hypothetical protein